MIGKLNSKQPTNKRFISVCNHLQSLDKNRILKKCNKCNYLLVSDYNSYLLFNNEIYEIALGYSKRLSIIRIMSVTPHLTLTDIKNKSTFKDSISLFDYIEKLEKINIFS